MNNKAQTYIFMEILAFMIGTVILLFVSSLFTQTISPRVSSFAASAEVEALATHVYSIIIKEYTLLEQAGSGSMIIIKADMPSMISEQPYIINAYSNQLCVTSSELITQSCRNLTFNAFFSGTYFGSADLIIKGYYNSSGTYIEISN